MNFTLNADEFEKIDETANQTDSVKINTATCTCEDPFVLNLDGTCTCPSGLLPTRDGKCLACQVEGCKTCSSLNVCSVCDAPYQLTSDKSMCVCP